MQAGRRSPACCCRTRPTRADRSTAGPDTTRSTTPTPATPATVKTAEAPTICAASRTPAWVPASRRSRGSSRNAAQQDAAPQRTEHSAGSRFFGNHLARRPATHEVLASVHCPDASPLLLRSKASAVSLPPGFPSSCAAKYEETDLVPADIGHNELLGGHGNDTIHAGPAGDVIWGDSQAEGNPQPRLTDSTAVPATIGSTPATAPTTSGPGRAKTMCCWCTATGWCTATAPGTRPS